VTRFILVRHAAPDEEARRRCYGRLDIGLSHEGFMQASSLASALSTVVIDALYCSPARRARETAAVLGEPTVDERLRELDFGEFEGRTYEDVQRADPELFRRWMEEPTRVRFPGGEAYEDLRVRVADVIAELRRRHARKTIVVVAHGGVIRSTLADALSLPREQFFTFDIGYCRLSVVDWFGEVPVVRLVNGAVVDFLGEVRSAGVV
jgi:alpha-ribazole phosphatase